MLVWEAETGEKTVTRQAQFTSSWGLRVCASPRFIRTSQVAQCRRIHVPMQETQETQVQSLGREDPLEKETATHSSILGWRIPQAEEPGGLQSMGLQRVRYN